MAAAAKAIGLRNNTILFPRNLAIQKTGKAMAEWEKNPWIWARRSGLYSRPVVAVPRSVSLVWNTPLPYSQLSCHSSVYVVVRLPGVSLLSWRDTVTPGKPEIQADTEQDAGSTASKESDRSQLLSSWNHILLTDLYPFLSSIPLLKSFPQ